MKTIFALILTLASFTTVAKTSLRCVIEKQIVTSEDFYGTLSRNETIILDKNEERSGTYIFDKAALRNYSWTFSESKKVEKKIESFRQVIKLLSDLEQNPYFRIEYKIKNNHARGAQVVLSSFNPKGCGSLTTDCPKTYLTNTDRPGSIETQIGNEHLSSMFITPGWINGDPVKAVEIDLGMSINCDHIIH